MVDLFTKYLNLFSIKTQTAESIVWFVHNKYVCEHGVPEQLYSDQGKNMNAEVVKEVCRFLHIWKTRPTPCHPQSDGQSERAIRIVSDMLTKYVSEAQDDSDEHLDHIAMAYNTSVHESTGFTPYFLNHGRKIRMPIDLIIQSPPDSSQLTSIYADRLSQKMKHAFQVANDNLQELERCRRTSMIVLSKIEHVATLCGITTVNQGEVDALN